MLPGPCAAQARFQGPASHEAVVFTEQGEGDIADPLARVAAEHPQVCVACWLAQLLVCNSGLALLLQPQRLRAAAVARVPQRLQARQSPGLGVSALGASIGLAEGGSHEAME